MKDQPGQLSETTSKSKLKMELGIYLGGLLVIMGPLLSTWGPVVERTSDRKRKDWRKALCSWSGCHSLF